MITTKTYLILNVAILILIILIIIYHKKNTYVHPHKHLDKAESFYLISGKALSIIWLGMSVGEFLLPVLIVYLLSFIYWRDLGFKSSNMLNCMIFVDDHHHLNGGLWVFSGSHKSMFKHTKFMNINSLQKYFIHPELLDKISKKHKPISISAKKGSCLFFHSKLHFQIDGHLLHA